MDAISVGNATKRSALPVRAFESVQSPSAVNNRSWFLIYTKASQESVANANLIRQQYETFLPLKQTTRKRSGVVKRAIEALFPRYLLVRLSAMHDNWGPIRSTTGVCNFVRFGEYFARLPDDLVDFLRNTQEVHGPRVIKPVQLAVGDRIRITDGVASGYEGIIIARTARDRVRLLLNTAAGYSAPVDVREQAIELVR